MFHKIRANPQWFAVLCIVQAFMITAAYISAGDIMTLATRWGVPTHLAWTAPVFIDGLTWMGKFGRSDRFAERTRTSGLKLMAFGGLMSLAANVAAGETIGMRVYGALVVVGFVTAEWYSTQLRPAPPAPAEDTAAVKAVRAWVVTQAEKDARKRAGYDKKSPAAKAEWTRQYRERVTRRTPTSPAPAPGPSSQPVPSLDELEAAVV